METGMKSNGSNDLERAAECWRGGQALEAGHLIFENLPNTIRPRWASRVLRLVVNRSGIKCSPVEEILRIADDPREWHRAHVAFDGLRMATLKLGRPLAILLTRQRELLGCILALAELVAKVTYNATEPPDEFDEDSGWWIAASLRGFVDHAWRDDEFAKAAWAALSLQEA